MDSSLFGDISLYEIQLKAKFLKQILNMDSYPVGVKFLQEEVIEQSRLCDGYRYCQALMAARHGENVYLNKEAIACPAAAKAFGFKALPEGLASGKGLVGFGIVSDPEVGKNMFLNMKCFKMGEIKAIQLFPLESAETIPDVVVMEDEVEKLMWVILAYMHLNGGRRVVVDTAVLQATCVDSTVIPYTDQRLNASFGCYGCREATDIKPGETVIGFPIKYLKAIVDHVDYLSQKAIPRSRGKGALSRIGRKDNDRQ